LYFMNNSPYAARGLFAAPPGAGDSGAVRDDSGGFGRPAVTAAAARCGGAAAGKIGCDDLGVGSAGAAGSRRWALPHGRKFSRLRLLFGLGGRLAEPSKPLVA